jgi:hypothetical protein
MKINRICLLMVVFLSPLVAIFTQCMNNKPDARGEEYAGSDKCIKCHQRIYNSYLQTAHFESSRPASIHSIHGSFVQNHNQAAFGDHSKVVMEKRGDSLYQVLYANGTKIREQHFDITFGGVKAETYLYWKGNELFQLPISYFNALGNWANSPGFSANHAYFDRPIEMRCFECHSSYIDQLPQQNFSLARQNLTEYDKSSLIYSIDCERCHGPATNHVNFQTANPTEKKARYIITYKSLTRTQKLDACAVCHAGNKDNFQVSAFKFKTGDTLAKFKESTFFSQMPNTATLDVHGNQNGLLAASKCFLKSNMDCGTCHDPHKNEASNLAAYSQRCMSCHNDANHNFCKAAPKLGASIKNNCIDCHMPLKPSNAIGIAMSDGSKQVPYLVRTHYIAVYPSAYKKIMAFAKDKKLVNQ